MPANPYRNRTITAAVFVVLALGLLVFAMSPGLLKSTDANEVRYPGTWYELPQPVRDPAAVTISATDGTTAVDLVLNNDGTAVQLPAPATSQVYTLTLKSTAASAANGTPANPRVLNRVEIIGARWMAMATAGAAAAAALLLLICLPYLIFSTAERPWLPLLTEQGGGYSLGSLQVVLWFAAGLVAIAVAWAPQLRFATVPSEVWELVGLGALTKMVSSTLSPAATKRETVAQTARSALRQLAEWVTRDPSGDASAIRTAQKDIDDWAADWVPPDMAPKAPDQSAPESHQVFRTLPNFREQQSTAVIALPQKDASTTVPPQDNSTPPDPQNNSTPQAPQNNSTPQPPQDNSTPQPPQPSPQPSTGTDLLKQAIHSLEKAVEAGEQAKAPQDLITSLQGLQDQLQTFRHQPTWRDLVQDWQSQGDLSRYQQLLITLIAVILFVFQVIQRLDFPTIPQQLMILVALSQATYLGVKAVKANQA